MNNLAYSLLIIGNIPQFFSHVRFDTKHVAISLTDTNSTGGTTSESGLTVTGE